MKATRSTDANKTTITFRFEGTTERCPKYPRSWRWDARRLMFRDGEQDERCHSEFRFAESEEEAQDASQRPLLALSDPCVRFVTIGEADAEQRSSKTDGGEHEQT